MNTARNYASLLIAAIFIMGMINDAPRRPMAQKVSEGIVRFSLQVLVLVFALFLISTVEW